MEVQPTFEVIRGYQSRTREYLKYLGYIICEADHEVFRMDGNPNFAPDSHMLRVYYLYAKGMYHKSMLSPEEIMNDLISNVDPYGRMIQPWIDMSEWEIFGFIRI